MANGILNLALTAGLMAGCAQAFAAFANEGAPGANGSAASCATSPDAVTTLSAPLSKWAQIVCTPSGYVITGRDGWIWLEPTHSALVVIPSRSSESTANGADKSSYFTKVELTKVKGEEFEKAYEVFHTGFDPKDAKPPGYRLDVTAIDGRDIRLYIFDYFTFGWGMACSEDGCDPSSRFVMLNMHQDPKPLPPPI